MIVAMESQHWYSQIERHRLFVIAGIPLLGVIGAFNVPLQRKTAWLTVAYYFVSGIALSAGKIYLRMVQTRCDLLTCSAFSGYHRLWSHRAYKAAFVTRVALAFFGASVGEGSALTWARDYRAHHRYTDTDADPYSVHKGLFYAHFGWIIFKQDRSLTGRADVSDLERDSVVMWH
jgi:stearoyl-CoA desaturase (delta-9 desaturase)